MGRKRVRRALFGHFVDAECCGLRQFVELRTKDEGWGAIWDADRGLATIATTTRHERATIRALKANGFKRVTKWRNINTGNVVTLWVWAAPMKKRRK